MSSVCTLSALLCPDSPGVFCSYCTSHTTHAFMLSAGFEPEIPASDQPLGHWDRRIRNCNLGKLVATSLSFRPRGHRDRRRNRDLPAGNTVSQRTVPHGMAVTSRIRSEMQGFPYRLYHPLRQSVSSRSPLNELSLFKSFEVYGCITLAQSPKPTFSTPSQPDVLFFFVSHFFFNGGS